MDLLSHFLLALKVSSTSLSKWTIHSGHGVDVTGFDTGYFLSVESGPPIDVIYQDKTITLEAGQGLLSAQGTDCKIGKTTSCHYIAINQLNWQGLADQDYSLENHYSNALTVSVGEDEVNPDNIDSESSPPTVLMGIAFSLEDRGLVSLGSMLPDYIHVSQNEQVVASDLLKNAINFMANDQNPGYFAMALQLAEFAVMSTIRSYLAEQKQFPVGLLRGLTNPGIGKALSLIYKEYDKPLNLDQLAKVSNMSRSRFAATFTAEIGETPIAFLNQIRIYHAQNLLAEGTLNLAVISEQSGFQSDRVFRQVFKRVTGVAPRDYRKEVRHQKH